MDRAIEWVLLEVPQPVFFVGLFIVLVLASLFGRWLRGRQSRRNGALAETQEDWMLSAVLGLLALLLGFTFAMAVDRYDKRRMLVTEEANAITSSYLMAQTFDEPDRGRINSTLVSYVDNRLAAARARGPKEATPLLNESQVLQRQLWAASLAATADVRDDVASTYLQHVTDAIAVGEQRVAARQSHIPPRVHLILLLYTVITAGVMGYAFTNSPQSVTSGTLFLLLTMSLVLIIDLDRPTSGGILESQTAMENLQARLKGEPPGAYLEIPTPPS